MIKLSFARSVICDPEATVNVVSGFEHPHKYGLETAPWPMEGAEAVNE